MWFFLVLVGTVLCWSGGLGQAGEPVPGEGERGDPGPGRVEAEVPDAGVVCEAAGLVIDPHPHGLGLGVGEAVLVVEGKEAEPGVEVGREHPATVCRPGLGWQVVPAHGLVRADAVNHPGFVGDSKMWL